MKNNPRNNVKYGVQFAYLLDSIYSEDVELHNDTEKLQHFFQCFEDEYECEYVKRQQPNESKRLAEYLRGMPSCINLHYDYVAISKLGASWGLCDTPVKAQNFINGWYDRCAIRLLSLRKFYNIKVIKK